MKQYGGRKHYRTAQRKIAQDISNPKSQIRRESKKAAKRSAILDNLLLTLILLNCLLSLISFLTKKDDEN